MARGYYVLPQIGASQWGIDDTSGCVCYSHLMIDICWQIRLRGQLLPSHGDMALDDQEIRNLWHIVKCAFESVYQVKNVEEDVKNV